MKAKWLAGVVFSCVAALAFPNVGLSGDIELLVDGGFESAVPIGVDLPLDAGYWSGDISQKVLAMDGITPLEGASMIKFIHAASYIAVPPDNHGWAQVYQLVDLSAYSSVISAGGTTATFSGYFNRVQIDDQTDTKFVARMNAYEGDPTEYASGASSIAYGTTTIYADSVLDTWEFASAEITLPVNAGYIAVCIVAVENVHGDPGDQVEFDGHYGDGMSLVFVPEPATLSLLALGGLALIRRRRL